MTFYFIKLILFNYIWHNKMCNNISFLVFCLFYHKIYGTDYIKYKQNELRYIELSSYYDPTCNNWITEQIGSLRGDWRITFKNELYFLFKTNYIMVCVYIYKLLQYWLFIFKFVRFLDHPVFCCSIGKNCDDLLSLIINGLVSLTKKSYPRSITWSKDRVT